MTPTMIAGITSGVVGLLVFLIVHHFLIQPIWFIFPIGLLLAAAGGLAVGWAYELLRPNLPDGFWTVPAVVGLILLILAPALIFAQLRAPLFRIDPEGAVLAVSFGRAAGVFILDLLVSASLMGALIGWLVGHSQAAALRTSLAGFIFALGPGHNIPFFSHRLGGVGKSWLLLGAIVLSASITLVLVERFLRTQ